MINATDIKALRDQTGLSVMQCKKALESSDGDMEKAILNLKEQGAAIASKKSDRELGSGVVSSYIHGGGAIGALVVLQCETDFVAKNEEFVNLAREIAMQLAAVPAETEEELLASPYIKDSSKTIGDLIQSGIQKFGENTRLGRFVRFAVGE